MKKIFVSSASLLASILPSFAFAQNSWGGCNSVAVCIGSALYLVKIAVPFLIAIAVIYFIWTIIQFTIAGGEEEKGKAKAQIGWGILGLFIIVSVWGLVQFLRTSTGIGAGSAPTTQNLIPNITP